MNPEAYNFVPPTFIYPLEQIKFKQYMKENSGACFIAKPSNGLKGKDIFLLRDINDIEYKNFRGREKTDYIVQRYIDKPLLMDGYKFDLRLYVTLFGSNPVDSQEWHSFIAKEGLARFCTQKYKKPTNANLKNNFMHLTNYSLNKASPDYVHEPENAKDILKPNQATKRVLSTLYK